MTRVIKASTSKIVWSIGKIIVLLTVIIFIYLKFKDNEQLAATTWDKFLLVFRNHYLIFIALIFLMWINWSLEAVKWKILMTSQSFISFWSALEAVLLGLSLSFITPHGIGDYFGRILHSKEAGRFHLFGAVMLGRFCQMVPTLLFGLVGVFFLIRTISAFYIVCSFIILLVILALLIFRRAAVRQIGKLVWIRKYVDIIGAYSSRTVIIILMLSILRYITFSLQFVIILILFLPSLPVHINIAGITWIFLAKSVLPTFNFLSDLGVREFSAIYFFEQYHTDLIAIFSASLTLWSINILLPTILASPLIVKLQLRAK